MWIHHPASISTTHTLTRQRSHVGRIEYAPKGHNEPILVVYYGRSRGRDVNRVEVQCGTQMAIVVDNVLVRHQTRGPNETTSPRRTEGYFSLWYSRDARSRRPSSARKRSFASPTISIREEIAPLSQNESTYRKNVFLVWVWEIDKGHERRFSRWTRMSTRSCGAPPRIPPRHQRYATGM